VATTEKWLKDEYFGIRTGRAMPALLDSVSITSYGAKTPLRQVASVSMEDARTLRIVPYDIDQTKEIEKAIEKSNLGVSVGVDEKGIRIFFPELTSESRERLLKLVNDKLEESKVTIRKFREVVWEDIREKEKKKEISEDEKFRAKEEMQKIVDIGNNSFEEIAKKKQTEIAN